MMWSSKILLLLVSSYAIIFIRACFLEDPEGACYLCSYDEYHPGALYRGEWEFYNKNDAGVNPLPCKKKTQGMTPKRLVLVTSLEKCEECENVGLFHRVYYDIVSSFTGEGLELAEFEEAELTILLQGFSPHYVLPSDLKNKQGINFFRRQNLKLSIEPLNCKFLNISGCFSEGVSSVLILKSPQFFVFVSSSLSMRNIKISAPDLFLWAGGPETELAACMDEKKQCCSEPQKRGTISDSKSAACLLMNRAFKGNLHEKKSLFNLETTLDDPNPRIPTILITNCSIHDMQTLHTDGFLGFISILNSRENSLKLTNLEFSNCFLPKGIIGSVSLNSPIGKAGNTTVALNGITLTQYNAYSAKFAVAKALFLFGKLTQVVELTGFQADNCFLTGEYIFYFEAEASNFSIDGAKIFNISGLLILYSEGASGAIKNLWLRNVALSSSSPAIKLADSNIIINASYFEVLFPADGTQISLLSVFGGRIKIAGLFIMNDFYSEMNFLGATALIAELRIIDSIFQRRFLSFYSITLATLVKIFAQNISGDNSFLEILGGSIGLSKIQLEGLQFKLIFDIIDVYVFLASNSVLSKCGPLDHFSAASQNYQLISFENCTFTEMLVTVFFTSYISIPGRLVFSGCLFKQINVNRILFELCCITFEVLSCDFERVIMHPEEGLYAFTFELSGNYLFKNINFTNFGFNEIKRSDWEWATGTTLWYGDSLTVLNVYCNLDAEFFMPGGFLAAERATYFVYIDNYTLISKATGPSRLVRAFLAYQVSNFEIRNSFFQGLGCPGPEVTLSFIHVNGVLSILNNFMFGGDGLNNFFAGLSNISFHYCQCQYGGGVSIVNYNNIVVKNLTLLGVAALFKGGGLLIHSSNSVELENVMINDSFAEEGSFLYLERVSHCSARNLSLNEVHGTDTGAFHLNMVGFVSAEIISASNCSTKDRGGVFFLEQTLLILAKSKFLFTSARLGGCLFLAPLSNLALQNTFSQEAEALEEAGFLYSEDSGSLLFYNIFLRRAKSLRAASCLLITGFNVLNISGMFMNQAETVGQGGILVRSSSERSLFSAERIACNSSKARLGSCLYIDLLTQVSLSNITIEKSSGGSLLQVATANLEEFLLNSCVITESHGDFLVFGKFAYFIGNSLFVSKSSFKKSLIFLQESSIKLSNAKVQDSAAFFENNQASVFELVLSVECALEKIYLKDFAANISSILRVNGGRLELREFFISKSALKDSVFRIAEISMALLANVTIEDTQPPLFRITNADSLIFGLKVTSGLQFHPSYPEFCIVSEGAGVNFMEITDSLFYGRLEALISTKGLRRFHSRNCFHSFKSDNFPVDSIVLSLISEVLLESNSYSSCKASKGGALSIFGKPSHICFVKIVDSKFLDNQAFVGSSIFLEGNIKLHLESCVFLENKAIVDKNSRHKETTGIAGVLYFNCTADSCEGLFSNCTFSKNRAESYAAGIFSNTLISENNSYPNLFIDNSGDYSVTMGSFARCAALILDAEEALACLGNSSILEFTSGESLEVEVGLIDLYGRIVEYDNQSIISVKPVDRTINVFYLQDNPAVVKGRKTFFSMKIKLAPHSEATLKIEIKQILPGSAKPKLILQYFTARALPCYRGFVIKPDLSCESCPFGTYSWEDPMTELKTGLRIQCRKCPENFFCPGGNLTFAERGFWRFSEHSLVAIKCKIQEACQGYILSSDGKWILEPCMRGHYGNLCHECLSSFGKFTKGGICESCDKERPLYIARLVCVILAVTLYVIINTYIFTRQVKNTQRKGEGASPFIVFKILLNHSQTMSLISQNLDFNSFPFYKTFLEFQSYFSVISEDVVSTECFLQNIYSKDYTNFIKVMSLVILPLAVGLGSFVFWFLLLFILVLFRKSLTSSVKNMLKKTLVSFTIAAYLLYPVIIQSVFSLSSCISLETGPTTKKSFLLMSPNITCWEETHMVVFLCLFLPSTIVWGALFPSILLYFLRVSYRSVKRNSYSGDDLPLSKSLQDGKIFRFFYEDYKPSCYYWEIVIFMKKFAMNILISSSEMMGRDLEKLLKLLVIMGYASVVIKKRPFSLGPCNEFEITSNFIFIISMSLLDLSEDKFLRGSQGPCMILVFLFNIAWVVLLCAFFITLLWKKKDAIRKLTKFHFSKFRRERRNPTNLEVT